MIETLDLEWYTEGGIQIFLLIALGLLVTTTVFCFLLWKKGDDDMLFKAIGYISASVATLGGFIAAMQFIGGSEGPFYTGLVICSIGALSAVGLRLFMFIFDKWIKEEKA